jgi:sporulation protein YlmC with PRC-barrel domain
MSFTAHDAKALHGLKVVDPEAAHVGRLEQIYVDQRTGRAEWATVRTGLLGTTLTFAPLSDAHTNPAGDVVVHARKHRIEGAPRIEHGDVLTPELERELYGYYGRPDDIPPEGETVLEVVVIVAE